MRGHSQTEPITIGRCRRTSFYPYHATKALYRVDKFRLQLSPVTSVQLFGATGCVLAKMPFWMRFSSWLGLDSILSRTRPGCVATANALSSEHQCIARTKSKVTIICLGKACTFALDQNLAAELPKGRTTLGMCGQTVWRTGFGRRQLGTG